MPEETYQRPTWVLPGETWTPGQTQAEYEKAGGKLATGVASILPAGGTINSENLAPNTEIPYITPTPIPTYDANTTPLLAPTPSENKAQDLSDELQKLNEQLLGESTYRTEKETEYDIVGKTQTINDLTNQLNILKNEAAAIPLQLEKEATGRGITGTILGRQQTSRLRDNAIQSLSVSALLQAANGNLATAQNLVDRAVAAKYDPFKEEINVKTANLQLILQSPDYTREEKNRAQAQLDIQNQKKDAITKAEAEQQEIWNISITAASNRADAVTLQKIQKATTKEEALRIAQEAGIMTETKAPQTQVVEIGGRRVLINSVTGNIIKDLGVITSEEKTVLKKKAITLVTPELEQSRGKDGYIDPNVYMRLRSDYAAAIGDVSEFDDVFASMLSPFERARLGVGKVVKPPTDSLDYENI